MGRKMSVLVFAVLSSTVAVNALAAEGQVAESDLEIVQEQVELVRGPVDAYYPRSTEALALGDSAYLDSLIPAMMDSLHIPGLAACVVRAGEIIYTGAYGCANFAQGIEVADTTLFMLASISKTVTGIALMQVWEDGLFGLDEDINSYLPFQVRNPWHPDSAITFRHVLTHTSGICDNWNVLYALGVLGDSPIPLRQFLEDYLVPGGAYYDSSSNFYTWPPGTQRAYCNVGFALAGYLVEAIADSFPVHCQNRIFDPLAMDETSWFLAGVDTNNLAMPYSWNGFSYDPYGHYGNPIYPAFQLRTSTLQLARYLISFMQYGIIDTARILDSTTVELMTTVQYPMIAPNQGLAWRKMYLAPRWLWGHSGGFAGVTTEMWYYLDENSGVVVLTNGESAYLDLVHELFEFAAQYGVAEAPSRKQMPEVLTLSQNHPNPFQHTTTIRFGVPWDDRASLRVYNVVGQEVATLVDGELKRGWHSAVFSPDGLASGVYFYRLRVGRFGQTRRCLLLR